MHYFEGIMYIVHVMKIMPRIRFSNSVTMHSQIVHRTGIVMSRHRVIMPIIYLAAIFDMLSCNIDVHSNENCEASRNLG